MPKFLFVIAASALLAACAQTPSGEHIVSSSSASSHHEDCLKTGTRIRLSEQECATAVSGRVYTQKEIEQTGAFTITEALRRLDPTL